MAELDTASIRADALDLCSRTRVSGMLSSWDNGLYGESRTLSREGGCHKPTTASTTTVNPMNRSTLRGWLVGACISDRAHANPRAPTAAINPASKTATVGS